MAVHKTNQLRLFGHNNLLRSRLRLLDSEMDFSVFSSLKSHEKPHPFSFSRSVVSVSLSGLSLVTEASSRLKR